MAIGVFHFGKNHSKLGHIWFYTEFIYGFIELSKSGTYTYICTEVDKNKHVKHTYIFRI